MVTASLVVAERPAGTSVADAAGERVRVSLIGDSTMSAMEWYRYDDADPDSIANNDIRDIVSASYDLTFDAESCRRIVARSCRGRFGYTPTSVVPLMQGALHGQLGEVLVVMAGYDDTAISVGIDQVMAEAAAQGVANVVWLTFPAAATYTLPTGHSASALYTRNNLELRAAAERYPGIRLLDWNAHTAANRSWLAGDGVHLSPAGAVALAELIKQTIDSIMAEPCRARNATGGDHDPGVGDPASPPNGTSGFATMTPRRVLDTRVANAAPGGVARKLGANRAVTVDVGDTLPPGATAAVLNVVAVEPCGAGYLTVFPCGQRPWVANVTFEAARDTAGMAITGLTGGRVCVFVSAATDLVVDVIGSFAPGGDRFHPIAPARWIDTRGEPALLGPTDGIAVGARTTGAEIEVPMRDRGGIADSASAVWLNLAVADPTAATVLLAYPGPCGQAPLAATVNARAGTAASSAALVGIGRNGSVCVRTVAGSSHVVIDVAGWFADAADEPGGLTYSARTPSRMFDSRDGSAARSQAPRTLALDEVTVLNVAAVDTSADGFVTARPCGSPALTALVNAAAEENAANVTALGPGGGGAVCLVPNVAMHLVVDKFGAFVPS